MTYEIFFAGVGGTLLGTLVGAWISCRMTYDFQKRLLQQQLDFQKKQAEEDAKLRHAMFLDWHTLFRDFQGGITSLARQIIDRLPPPQPTSK